MKKKPYSEFVEIALEGQLEVMFCELFDKNGEPRWNAINCFLNGSKEDTRVGLIDAFERRLEGEKDINDPERWEGVTKAQKEEFLKRTGNALITKKPPTPDKQLEAAWRLHHANILTGGDIPNGVRKNQANIRQLEIINPDLTEAELKEAKKTSGLSEAALVHARKYCEDYEGIKLPDERYNKPL